MDSELIAFIAVTDVDRALAFYRDRLGLDLVEESPFGCVFRSGPTMLRVTRVDEVRVAPYTVLGWRTDDIFTEVRTLTGRGVVFTRYDDLPQDDIGIWHTPSGDRVAWFLDPDGNTLSLTQFSTA
jgi:catechol 2,3-dioxygenase-like lactoylglutathione lyase family enzyme